MKIITLFVVLFISGCPMNKEEKRVHAKEQLDCFVYKKNCFCYMTSITHAGWEVYSPTWAPMDVCNDL